MPSEKQMDAGWSGSACATLASAGIAVTLALWLWAQNVVTRVHLGAPAPRDSPERAAAVVGFALLDDAELVCQAALVRGAMRECCHGPV